MIARIKEWLCNRKRANLRRRMIKQGINPDRKLSRQERRAMQQRLNKASRSI
jgi:hypothetical protein